METPAQKNNPFDTLDQWQSRGRRTGKAKSLGDLHAKRAETLSQYFTPAWLVRFAWDTLAPAFEEKCNYTLLDNSIGAGSMFRCADPARFALAGFDVDAPLVSEVAHRLDEAGYRVDIRHGSMEKVVLDHYSAGLINPPFSIPLHSPTLSPYPGITHYGRMGPDSSAVSHEYALAQALDHCDLVAAVVPSGTAPLFRTLAAGKRLRAIYHLPRNTFQSENVRAVNVDLLVFGVDGHAGPVLEKPITPTSRPDRLDLGPVRDRKTLRTRPLSFFGAEQSAPVITLPPTDDKRVILRRAGRHIALRFFDGITEGRVKNMLYRKRLHSTKDHRYPKGTHWAGQFRLSLDVMVMQSDPDASLAALADQIHDAGGVPVIEDSVLHGLKALQREHARMTIPYQRTVYRKGTPKFSATARRMGLINRRDPGAVVTMGETVSGQRIEHGFSVTCSRGTFTCSHDAFFELFVMEDRAVEADYWEQLYPPIRETYPDAIAALEARARKLGLDRWLSWDFQLEDLCELAFRPRGGICGWQMALGKTRLALALGRLLHGRTLIITHSRLLDEFGREIAALGLDEKTCKILRTSDDLNALGKINLISYEFIRRPRDKRYPHTSPAYRLRRAFRNILADEGGVLANRDSLQTRAIWNLGGQRRYILDGTPSPNYPREMLPLVAWTHREALSYQPYSLRGGHLYAGLWQSATGQATGRQAFFDRFVCYEWATNEFLDSGHGARREVPKIRPEGLAAYRTWLAPVVLRRVQQEPAVRRHVRFPIPTLNPPTVLEWDEEHLALYLDAVDNFATWYRNYMEESLQNAKALNLTVILARLEACFKAANVPANVEGFAKPYHALTSKDRAAVEWVKKQIADGKRPIVFARSPTTLSRLGTVLTQTGISVLVFTGRDNIDKRTKALNANIRQGSTQVMLASLGVTQDGLNLPQLNAFLFYNRSYKSREEFQGIYRLIRPQQTSEVSGDFLHLAGSIDEYMGQLIEWKQLASEAGLDYGEQPLEKDFEHFDVFIRRFLESAPLLRERLEKMRRSRRNCA